MIRCLIVAFACLLASPAVSAEPDKSEPGLEGLWEGKLKVNGGLELRLAFKFVRKTDGGFTGTMDSIDQGAKNLALDEVTLSEREVAFTFKVSNISYTGTLDAKAEAIQGTFRQAGAKLPLELRRVEKISVVSRPQEPKPPFPYRAEDVIYENPAAEIKLGGTLTIPEGNGPFPAVLLITGSGPQDRDEQLLGHKPFLVLADHLTRNGIVVLRVDDRGVGQSTGTFAKATTLDFLEDVLAGVAFLKGRPEVEAKRIGLAGHSEGGLIAPLAAVKSRDVAFIVMLAGPGTTGAEILAAQSRLIAKGMGATDEVIAFNTSIQRRTIAVALDERDDAVAKRQIAAAIREEFEKLSPVLKLQMLIGAGTPAADVDDSSSDKPPTPEERLLASIEQSAAALLTPWFRYFVAYDPRPTLAQVQCPVLALIGEKDLQVPAEDNLLEIRKALEQGGNRDATVLPLPGLNHLFQTCKTGLPAEYAQIDETIAPAALKLIAKWIADRK
ncbi:MAG: alpha/beta hydrolase [Planctomycetaceae bacterium]|nr:alpha/beta hydrolase [Planctomycetaceae bacterium]